MSPAFRTNALPEFSPEAWEACFRSTRTHTSLDRTLQIAFLTEYFPPETNAAASRVFERARLWAGQGHDVTVITTVPNFPEGRIHPDYRNRWRQEEVRDAVRVVRVKSFVHPNRGRIRRTLDQASFMPGALLAALRLVRPDVVVATSPTLFAASSACLTGIARRIPFVLEVGDLGSASIHAVGAVRARRLLGAVERLEAFLCRRAARVIVQTSRMKQAVVDAGWAEEEKVAVITNGVDVDRFRDVAEAYTPHRRTGRFVVGYIGTIGLAHGLDVVLEAAAHLSDSTIEFHLVGTGAARAGLETAARNRGLTNVHFGGPYPRHRITEAWASVNLALVSLKDHPTFSTVVPSKIFEAMACGVPVLLAAPEGEAAALVRRHDIGTVIPPGDAPALVDAVKRLAADPDRLHRQSENARRAVVQYDRPAQAAEYLGVLRAALHASDASRARAAR